MFAVIVFLIVLTAVLGVAAWALDLGARRQDGGL